MKDKLIGIAIGVLAATAFFFVTAFRSEGAQQNQNSRFLIVTSVSDYSASGAPLGTVAYLLDTEQGRVWRASGTGNRFELMQRIDSLPK